MKTDIIIIGAGPGGYETAVYAAKHGLSVTIVEGAKLGGTCLNEGCIPTKSFCRNAALMEDMKHASNFGFDNLSYDFNFSKVVSRKNEVVSTLICGIEFLLKNKLIRTVHGYASFKDAKTVLVDGVEYEGDHILIATGSVTKYLQIEGVDLPNVITSKEMLDIGHIPKRLCIIGAGVIGLEFASIFNAFGSKVTVLEYAKDILPNFDIDLTKRLKQVYGKKGIEIINSAGVEKIEQVGDTSLKVCYKQKDENKDLDADLVLQAVGRVPNINSLNLENIGLSFSSKGIAVNEYMQTNIPSVYAIGDINGECLLAHSAIFQGMKVVNHILEKADTIDLSIVPSAVFTFPEVAVVGLTEEQCKSKGILFKAKKSFFRANGKSLSMGESEGYCKLLVDDRRKIIGCHMFGPHTADLIHEISALMACGATIDKLKDMIHIHPTLSEVIQECVGEF